MRKIPRLSVSEEVYLIVKDVLLSNRYSPGERIGIEELCRELEVSRTPVFDALNRLQAEGMVEIVPRKGVYLVTFSTEKAQELYAVRENLESMATRLAAKNFTQRHVELVKAALDKQASCLEKYDVEGYARATIEFHDTILEAAGNMILRRMLGAIYAQISALRLRSLYLPTRLRKSFTEHQRIYEALLQRDPGASERAARKHVKTTTADVLAIIEEHSKKKADRKQIGAEERI